jgi:hypothetical protein
MKRSLIEEDLNQDYLHLLSTRRHYTRDLTKDTEDDKLAADQAYEDYLKQVERQFHEQLAGNPGYLRCKTAMRKLGRLTHSWQDFYGHAIRRDGEGGKEETNVKGWEAWTVGVTGTPKSRGTFYPSSWGLWFGTEHPPLREPFSSGAESDARSTAARSFVNENLPPLLKEWLSKCRCPCENAWLW